MQLASSTVQIGQQLYFIEYHSGESFRWKWNAAQALISASTYDASPTLYLNSVHFGFDGNSIVQFAGFELLSGIYYTILGSNRTDYKINPKTEYVEKVPSITYNGTSALTLPTGIINFNTSINDAMIYGIAPMKIEYNAKFEYKCDCGGRITFNEANEHFTVNHSRWCELVKNGITK